MRVSDLRQQSNIVIPEGVERIGSYWFYGSAVQSVAIPSTVKEIGTAAFSNCSRLMKVTFADDSRLEKIGKESFNGNCFQEITLSGTLKEIGSNAFAKCRSCGYSYLDQISIYVKDGCSTLLFS